MDAPTAVSEAAEAAPVRNPAIPDSLICELCGINPVSVIVSWLEGGNCDRHCGSCYLSTATSVVLALAGDAAD